MKSNTSIFLSLILMTCLNAKAEVKVIEQDKGAEISITGYITDIPRHFSNSRSESYYFTLSASPEAKYGDEYYLVYYHTKLWGEKVGEWNYSKGDKINLKGVFFRRINRETGNYEKAKGGLMGALEINDFSYDYVFKKNRKPAIFELEAVKNNERKPDAVQSEPIKEKKSSAWLTAVAFLISFVALGVSIFRKRVKIEYVILNSENKMQKAQLSPQSQPHCGSLANKNTPQINMSRSVPRNSLLKRGIS